MRDSGILRLCAIVNRKCKARATRPSVTSNYTYDPLYQLTQVTQAATTTESYSYDAVGNRLTSLGVSSYTVNNSNELTATPTASYTYDSNGNTVTKTVGSNTTTYAWDYENRLTGVTLPGTGGTVTFKYDPLGRRIEKVSPTFTSIFAYDGDNLIETVNSSGTVVSRYAQTQNIDEPLAELRSGGVDYYEADGLGSVTSLTATNGTVAQSYTNDSFGKQTASSGSLQNPFDYTGREFDSETNLYYYRARYYDPTAGRFVSEDPIGFKGGANFYRYVRNNSVDFADPTGLYTLKGFSPTQAAQMAIAVGQLAAKMKANPCCVDPKTAARILNLLQPFNDGSGITFVYKQTLASSPGYATCAEVAGLGAFLSNTVEISQAALDGTCGCPLPGTILHEATHLTWSNYFGSAPERGAYGNASACFGLPCSMPPGLTTP